MLYFSCRLLIYVPDNWFIPLCVVVRVLQGTGFAAFVTSTYAILVTLFTNEMAQIFVRPFNVFAL